MILPATSVWIDYSNGIESKKVNVLDAALIEGKVKIGDFIPFVDHLGLIAADTNR